MLGALANITSEYATKRYRSNCMNWGMIPFQMAGEPDALAARRIGADYIITRDAKGFERSEVRAVSPSSFLEIMEKEHGIVYEALALGA